jgi:hypothetical protein
MRERPSVLTRLSCDFLDPRTPTYGLAVFTAILSVRSSILGSWERQMKAVGLFGLR